MRRSFVRGIRLLLLAGAAWSLAACSTADVNKETIASVNGEEIKVQELREFLGVRGGVDTAAGVPVATKRMALDRLTAGRLIAMQARAMGLDNTEDFRNLVKKNEQVVLINALFRKEMASKFSVSKGEIKDEAGKMMKADKALSEDNAFIRARRVVSDTKLRKMEEDLIAAARKETPVAINQAEVDRIGKGDKVGDGAALATVGAETITYGDVKRLLGQASAGSHGGQDLSVNVMAIGRVLDREATGKSLAALARKQGVEGSEWMKTVRADMERSILIDMLAQKEVLGKVDVTDKDVAAAYAEHGEMFVQNGRKIPLSAVKEKLREFLRSEKQKKALASYIDELTKKARIKVREDLLPKV